MSGIHNNCVPKTQYWSMYNKFKGDAYYIESRKLRLENKLLKDTIIELESKLKTHLTPSPLVVSQDKPTSDTRNLFSFYRGSQTNHRKPAEKPIEYNLNRCKATIRNGRQCKQCNNSNQAGGPILNGYCGYHSHLR